MDGKTVQRIRILERSNAELSTENTYLSAEVLRMHDRLTAASRSAHVDRLLTAALVQFILGEASGAVVELDVHAVAALRQQIATPPGLSVTTTKDEARSVWCISLTRNPGSIRDCSACGADHDALETRPPSVEELDITPDLLWVATCPAKSVEVYATRGESARAQEPASGPSLIVMP